jgi:hypothetical protein
LNQKYTLAHQQMQQDYERLKQEENDKSNKLQELMYVSQLIMEVGMIIERPVVGSHW